MLRSRIRGTLRRCVNEPVLSRQSVWLLLEHSNEAMDTVGMWGAGLRSEQRARQWFVWPWR